MTNPQITVLVFLIGAIIFIIAKIKFSNKFDQDNIGSSRPANNTLPQHEKQNDKLVLVTDISETDIEAILKGFCNMYNEEKFQALPRLFKISEKEFAITFPHDIDFEIFCYFINYMCYPSGFDRSFKVTGWTTTNKKDTWISEQSANKKVMLYIPADDTEHDNVFMTTEDNIGYKLGFAMGEEKELQKSPKQIFSSPPVDITELNTGKFTDFK